MTGRLADGLRRCVDVMTSLTLLVVLSPVIGVVAVAVRVRMGAPVTFRQPRLGRGGVPFTLYKFRSMHAPGPGHDGPEFDHLRLGRLGRFLRSTSLDELPSLVNLLRGEIGLVGPRPLPLHYWPRFSSEQLTRFEVKPGITGLAQVAGRNAVDWPERLALDVRYVRERTLRLDMRVLLQTVPVVLGRSGVDHADGITMHELPPR